MSSSKERIKDGKSDKWGKPLLYFILFCLILIFSYILIDFYKDKVRENKLIEGYDIASNQVPLSLSKGKLTRALDLNERVIQLYEEGGTDSISNDGYKFRDQVLSVIDSLSGANKSSSLNLLKTIDNYESLRMENYTSAALLKFYLDSLNKIASSRNDLKLAYSTLEKEKKIEEIENRKYMAEVLRDRFLDMEADVLVNVSGKELKTIKLKYARFNVFDTNKLKKSGIILEISNAGFDHIIITNGYNYTANLYSNNKEGYTIWK